MKNNIEHTINEFLSYGLLLLNNVNEKKSTTNVADFFSFCPIIEKLIQKMSIIKQIEGHFFVLKVNNNINLTLFTIYTIYYFLDSDRAKTLTKIGMDFEFNNNKIGLWQLAFFPKSKGKYIFILDPEILEKKCNDNFTYANIVKQTIFTSKIHKIVHGADSLDLPYIFNNFLKGDKSSISKFIRHMTDTRYLCEFIKIYKRELNRKCSLYDALLYFNVIDSKKYDELQEVNKKMGPIQHINWDVNNMSTFNLKYALYDVIYLKQFLKKMFLLAEMNKITDQLKLIPQIDRFICYEKYGICSIVQESKEVVDKLNNYIVYDTKFGNQTRLADIYNNVIYTTKMKNILEINNFKKVMMTTSKYIVYSIVMENYKVYETKDIQYNTDNSTNMSYVNIKQILVKLELNDVVTFLESFANEVLSLL